MGVSLHYPPYETFDLDGRYQGLSADFIRLIGEKVGLKFVPVRFRNREQVMKAIQEKRVDLVAALEMTPERRDFLDFTQPYISVPAAIITRKEFTDDLTLDKLDGMRIGVTVSEHFTKFLKERFKGDYTIVPMAGGYIGGLRSLAVGDVDALICDMALASRYIANARISNLRIAGITNYSIDLCIATRKDEPVLSSILRKGLALIMPHERQIIEEEWLSLRYRPFWASRTFWMGLFAAFGVVFGGIVLVLFWNRSLKQQVAQRTKALSSINRVLLGSLDCHTEREVMLRCLEEARSMSASDYAFLAQVAVHGRLTALLSVSSETAGAHEADETEESTAGCNDELHAMSLAPARLEELKEGFATKSDIADRGMHLVAIPLQQDGSGKLRVIAVVRRRGPYTSSEAASLAEVLFAFEEALQRKRAEISLHDKERQLQRVQRMEALGTLAGGIAHDFNNILGVIIANGEMIELFHLQDDNALEAKTRALLAAAYRGRDLVSQILSYTRQRSEETRFLTISPIIKETVKFLEASLPASITIEYTICSPEPYVLADPTQVHQVLMNLCTNAAHAMEGYGGTLTISLVPAASPSEGSLETDRFLCLEVRDTGCGIAPQVQERIFDPFFTTKAPGEGTGLGLAVVQGIVKSWGGNVQVRSALGQGAVFRVLFPAYMETAGQPPGKIDAMELSPGTGNILFVDDEETLVSSFHDFLVSLGYNVQAVSDSRQALRIFMTNPQGVDMVITDYSMPGLRGDRLAQAILELRPDLPVVLCTGYSHSFNESEAAAMGIREFLKKPVGLRELAVAVRKYIRPHVGQSTPPPTEGR